MASAPSNAALDLGQSFECTTVEIPGMVLRHFCSSRQPARYSCSPAPWLGLPAMNTIFLSTDGAESANAKINARTIQDRAADILVCCVAGFPTCAPAAVRTRCRLESRRYSRQECLRHEAKTDFISTA